MVFNELLTNVRYADDLLLYSRSDIDVANMVGCLVVESAAVGCNSKCHYLFAADRRATARTMETLSHAATKKNKWNTSKTKILTTQNLKAPMFLAIGAERMEMLHGGQKNVGKHLSGDLWKKAIVDIKHRSQIG